MPPRSGNDRRCNAGSSRFATPEFAGVGPACAAVTRRLRRCAQARMVSGRGYATLALRVMLPRAWDEGLPYVELTTDPDNEASRRVIEANGGRLVERFIKPVQYG